MTQKWKNVNAIIATITAGLGVETGFLINKNLQSTKQEVIKVGSKGFVIPGIWNKIFATKEEAIVFIKDLKEKSLEDIYNYNSAYKFKDLKLQNDVDEFISEKHQSFEKSSPEFKEKVLKKMISYSINNLKDQDSDQTPFSIDWYHNGTPKNKGSVYSKVRKLNRTKGASAYEFGDKAYKNFLDAEADALKKIKKEGLKPKRAAGKISFDITINKGLKNEQTKQIKNAEYFLNNSLDNFEDKKYIQNLLKLYLKQKNIEALGNQTIDSSDDYIIDLIQRHLASRDFKDFLPSAKFDKNLLSLGVDLSKNANKNILSKENQGKYMLEGNILSDAFTKIYDSVTTSNPNGWMYKLYSVMNKAKFDKNFKDVINGLFKTLIKKVEKNDYMRFSDKKTVDVILNNNSTIYACKAMPWAEFVDGTDYKKPESINFIKKVKIIAAIFANISFGNKEKIGRKGVMFKKVKQNISDSTKVTASFKYAGYWIKGAQFETTLKKSFELNKNLSELILPNTQVGNITWNINNHFKEPITFQLKSKRFGTSWHGDGTVNYNSVKNLSVSNVNISKKATLAAEKTYSDIDYSQIKAKQLITNIWNINPFQHSYKIDDKIYKNAFNKSKINSKGIFVYNDLVDMWKTLFPNIKNTPKKLVFPSMDLLITYLTKKEDKYHMISKLFNYYVEHKFLNKSHFFYFNDEIFNDANQLRTYLKKHLIINKK